LKMFEALSIRDDDWLGGLERLGEPAAVKPPDDWAGHDEPPFGQTQPVQQSADALEGAVGQCYRVWTRRSRDVNANRIHSSEV
jgi:hypothetical protein